MVAIVFGGSIVVVAARTFIQFIVQGRERQADRQSERERDTETARAMANRHDHLQHLRQVTATKVATLLNLSYHHTLCCLLLPCPLSVIDQQRCMKRTWLWLLAADYVEAAASSLAPVR